MRKAILTLLPCLLAYSPHVWAGGEECVRRGIAAKTGMALEDVAVVTADQAPLFVELGAGAAIGDRITFEVLAGGKPFLTEKVELVKDPALSAGQNARPREREKLDLSAVPVVELLSANPARLGAVYSIAKHQAVELRVSRNGEVVHTVPLAELAAASERLSQGPLAPFALRSTVRNEVERRPVAQKNACIQFCDDMRDDCYLNRCGQFGGISCYDACDGQWIGCLEWCGLCQPSSTSSTSSSLVSITPLNFFECHTSDIQPLGIYRVLERLHKRTVTTTTTNADCTQTVTTQVSYVATYCWVLHQEMNCTSLGEVGSC